MSLDGLSCPKCQGDMVRGFVFNRMNLFVIILTQWASGVMKKSFWCPPQPPWDGTYLPTATFRCEACGFLESYARPEFAAK